MDWAAGGSLGLPFSGPDFQLRRKMPSAMWGGAPKWTPSSWRSQARSAEVKGGAGGLLRGLIGGREAEPAPAGKPFPAPSQALRVPTSRRGPRWGRDRAHRFSVAVRLRPAI